MTPEAGRVTNPTTPLPMPLKKPSTPSSRAPSIGFVKIPVTPSNTPWKMIQTGWYMELLSCNSSKLECSIQVCHKHTDIWIPPPQHNCEEILARTYKFRDIEEYKYIFIKKSMNKEETIIWRIKRGSKAETITYDWQEKTKFFGRVKDNRIMKWY